MKDFDEIRIQNYSNQFAQLKLIRLKKKSRLRDATLYY